MDKPLRWLELAEPHGDFWDTVQSPTGSPLLVRYKGDPLGWIGLPEHCVRVDQSRLHQQVAEQLDYPLLQKVGETWIGKPPQRPGCRGLSVVVLVRRGGPLLERCLEALARQRRAPCEVLLAGVHPEVPRPAGTGFRWIGGFSGPGAARNRGWQSARSEVIAFTDESARPTPEWIERLGAAFEPGTSAVGGPVLVEGIAVPEQGWYEQSRDGSACGLERFHVDGDTLPLTRRLWASYLEKRNVAVRRSALSGLGGFDESLDRFGDESVRDYIHRLLEDGGRLSYEPAALVTYIPPGAPAALRRHAFETGYGFAAYLRRRRGRLPAGRLRKFTLNQWWRRRLLSRLRRPCGFPRSLVLLEMAGALWPARERPAGERTSPTSRQPTMVNHATS